MNDPIIEKVPSKETRAWEERQIITSTQQLNCILGCSRNVIPTQNDTWEMTVRHMLTSEHLRNYWCWSLRYQLGNLQSEVISSTRKRRKSRLLQACQFVRSIVCQGKDNTGEENGWREGAPVAKGRLSSHFIAWIQILELQQGT